MDATINFNLNESEDITRYDIHNQAERLYYVMWEFMHNTQRKFLKYNENNFDSKQLEAVEKVFETLHEELNEENINMDIN